MLLDRKAADMSDVEQIRVRATRLFALAIKAREDGKLDNADVLTKLASESFEQATRHRHPRLIVAAG
jgi:hypothetical protein